MITIGAGIMTAPRRWAELARLAEAAGFESVWVPEHLVMPVHMTGAPNTPHADAPPISASTPAYDPWVELATMAAVTESVRLGTYVFNIGLRHPFVTARAVTTLDNVSDGRVILGIGASWLRQEWEATELPFDSRGRRVDETIGIVKRLFTEDVVEHDGEFFRFQPVGFVPKPVQQPWPPMLIGGDSPAAMRRAALHGDGWIPMDQTPETLPGNLERIRRMRAEAGRAGSFEVTIGARIESVDDVRRYEEAGATRLIVMLDARHPTTYQRFGDDIIANL
jgi:probable F420-dependent oxidoreductase